MVGFRTRPPARLWREAQSREIRAWERMERADAAFLRRRGKLVDAWARFWARSDGWPRRALEIGGAGLPAVDFLEGYDERCAADPLMEEYVRLWGGEDLCHPVERRAARAEELPWEAGSFDTVVMLNVLDHVEDPVAVLREIRRVLRPEGVLLMSVDTYSRAWLLARAIRVTLTGKRNNDILHPHHFTVARAVELVGSELEVLEIANRHADPLDRESKRHDPYPTGGLVNRLKAEGRLYLAARSRG